MNMIRRTLIAAACLALAAPALTFAQGAFPDRAVKLVAGFPPGTAPDTVARLLGQKLETSLKQSVLVDNRAGAGGQIATQVVAKSPADGYTLLLGEVGSISIAPPAFSKLPYDPAKELAVVSEVVRSDFLLVVPVQSPHKTVAEFVTAAKADKDRVNFATFGAGSPGHFGAEMLANKAASRSSPSITAPPATPSRHRLGPGQPPRSTPSARRNQGRQDARFAPRRPPVPAAARPATSPKPRCPVDFSAWFACSPRPAHPPRA